MSHEVQRTQLRQLGQQSEGDLLTHAWDGAQEVIVESQEVV